MVGQEQADGKLMAAEYWRLLVYTLYRRRNLFIWLRGGGL